MTGAHSKDWGAIQGHNGPLVLFGDVTNIRINGNHEILEFTFTLEIQKCNNFNVLLYIHVLFLFSICFLCI